MEELYIKKVIEGDEQGYRYFIRRYQDMAFSIAISVVKDEFLAEEVVQEAFMKAFEKMPAFKQQSKFSTWFYRIIVNKAFRQLDKEKKWKNEPLVAVEDAIETIAIDQLESDERKYFINETLKVMAPNESLALRLFYLEELSLNEVGDITGWSASKLKVVIHRARKSFYSHLNAILKKESRLII
ncbi:sigma-70 family RNA polymerase sigma factor [Carboxylicivirga sediminis]|uniref:RNA polymerase sigma factor n=1 Tax=Carboxylicivirga sediminis TaxID=2006564 RepID=A0A941F6U2_9BACT|nr:sigma-70 family RNA polymerase sigma factor [Carboxylicivirga sediminis]MBR8537512.1 sigma-70 family RNA polymerase sigma factor [Carboxylicivirga sediminis]